MITQKKENSAYKKNIIGKIAEIKTPNKIFTGKILIETKNTITIQTHNLITKKILKKNSIIKIENKIINGKNIIKRTEDRIKTR